MKYNIKDLKYIIIKNRKISSKYIKNIEINGTRTAIEYYTKSEDTTVITTLCDNNDNVSFIF